MGLHLASVDHFILSGCSVFDLFIFALAIYESGIVLNFYFGYIFDFWIIIKKIEQYLSDQSIDQQIFDQSNQIDGNHDHSFDFFNWLRLINIWSANYLILSDRY